MPAPEPRPAPASPRSPATSPARRRLPRKPARPIEPHGPPEPHAESPPATRETGRDRPAVPRGRGGERNRIPAGPGASRLVDDPRGRGPGPDGRELGLDRSGGRDPDRRDGPRVVGLAPARTPCSAASSACSSSQSTRRPCTSRTCRHRRHRAGRRGPRPGPAGSGVAVVAATAGGLAGILVAAPVGAAARAAFVGVRELRALAIAGALAIIATAWLARPTDDLIAVPAVFGFAYLAFALAVAIRFGAIPFHLWAARVADAAPGVALPLLLAWGPAAFAAVALCLDRPVGRAARPAVEQRARVDRDDRCRVGGARIVFDSGSTTRACRRLHDRRGCGVRRPRPGRLRSGGLGAEPDLATRVRRRAQRVRSVGRRDSRRVRHAPPAGACRVGAPCAGVGAGPRRDRGGRRGLARIGRLAGTVGAGPSGPAGSAGVRRHRRSHRVGRDLRSDPVDRDPAS